MAAHSALSPWRRPHSTDQHRLNSPAVSFRRPLQEGLQSVRSAPASTWTVLPHRRICCKKRKLSRWSSLSSLTSQFALFCVPHALPAPSCVEVHFMLFDFVPFSAAPMLTHGLSCRLTKRSLSQPVSAILASWHLVDSPVSGGNRGLMSSPCLRFGYLMVH